MWNNPQKSSGYPYGTIPKSRDITSGSRIETARALFLQWFTARLLGCFISGLYILRDLDRIVCFNHLLYCSGCFMLRHSSHIFIMDSWVWTITGNETSLLLFIHFTLSPGRYLCHGAHYYYSCLLTSSSESTFIQNVFSCDFRLASSSENEEKRRKVSYLGLCHIHLLWRWRTSWLMCETVVSENMSATWRVWDVLSSHTWHKFFPGPEWASLSGSLSACGSKNLATSTLYICVNYNFPRTTVYVSEVLWFC